MNDLLKCIGSISAKLAEIYSNTPSGNVSGTMKIFTDIENYLNDPAISLKSDNEQGSKGRKGEEFICAVIDKAIDAKERKTSIVDYERVSSKARTGDILIKTANFIVLVEVKNCANCIPKAELDKFRRDMAAKNVSGGFFISLDSAIPDRPRCSIVYEYIEGTHKPCAYLQSNSEDNILCAFELLVNALQLSLPRPYSSDKVLYYAENINRQVDEIEKQSSSISENIEKTLKLVSKNKNAFMNIRNEINKNTNCLMAEVREEIVQSESIKFLEDKYKIANEPIVKYIFDNLKSSNNINTAKWRLLQTKAVHVESSCGFGVKSGTISDFIIGRKYIDGQKIKMIFDYMSDNITEIKYDKDIFINILAMTNDKMKKIFEIFNIHLRNELE